MVAALSTFLQADQQRKEHDGLAAAWDNLRQDVFAAYVEFPDSEQRIKYYKLSGRRYEHRLERRLGKDDDLVEPPDPGGWQTQIKQLQGRAKLLRRGKYDDGKVAEASTR